MIMATAYTIYALLSIYFGIHITNWLCEGRNGQSALWIKFTPIFAKAKLNFTYVLFAICILIASISLPFILGFYFIACVVEVFRYIHEQKQIFGRYPWQ